MSRIGEQPVLIPNGVEVSLKEQDLSVKGPKGQLQRAIHSSIKVAVVDNKIVFERKGNLPKDKALHGTMRSLTQNMVKGVTEGFLKKLEIVGVGYKAASEGKMLKLNLGFTHPVECPIPEGITIKVEKNTMIEVSGIDKELVGKVAAEIRGFCPPEPYKGKGIRYFGEHVKRKVGKKVA